MHLREDARDVEITMPHCITGLFFLKAELHGIMSWDTWELPQKFSAENERSISFTFILGNMELCLHWYLPREPWENGSGCSGCFISMKIYHSSKDRKKYEPKEKTRLLLMQSISFLWYFSETFNPLILQHPLMILHTHETGKEKSYFSPYINWYKAQQFIPLKHQWEPFLV